MKKLFFATVLMGVSGSGLAAGAEGQPQRFSAALGYSAASTGGDSLIPVQLGTGYPRGTDVENSDDAGGATLGLNWYITPSIALELWSASSAKNRVEIDVENGRDISVASYSTRPIALSLQYHFRQMGDRVVPFVGLGYHHTQVNGVSSNPALPSFDGLRIEDGNGLAATVGLDVNWGKRWFARADARYLQWDGRSYLGSQEWVNADQHSLYYGGSIGVRF